MEEKVMDDFRELFAKIQKSGNSRDYLDIMEAILENDLVGFAVIDLDGEYKAFNRGAEKLTGFSKSELLGSKLDSALYSEEDYESIRNALSGDIDIRNREIKIRRSDGREKELIFSMSPQRNSDGAITCYLQILIDNSQKKHLQDLLLHSQKMETIGEMAGGIAHDFNNLLEGILGYTSFMMDLIEPGHELWTYLEIVERSARKASELTERLLTLSSNRTAEKSILNCNALIREVIKLFEKTIDKKIVLETNLFRNLKAISGSATQLEQALLNICLNAKDAMPDGGKLVVTSANIEVDDSYPKISLSMAYGSYVRISISDTGIGMDERTVEKIFEPFFTTKARGEGTGLGLNMVYGIVHNHGGFIDVYSEVGKGTTFNIYLRAEKDDLPEESDERERIAYKPGEGQTVLIIDDEPMILDIGSEMLEKLGYKALTAVNSEKGMKYFNDRIDEISLIILDIIMPGENGKEVLDKIREIRKEIPVILSSGYDRSILDRKILDDANIHFMQKPYSIGDLGLMLNRIFLDPEE
ncbi:MAG: PAS domain S-box protein [Candidatus Krumholzibacteriota bacterium]|nr:PAS domain S-box protein [Candidatus Krumholzibacteriota bacterium]